MIVKIKNMHRLQVQFTCVSCFCDCGWLTARANVSKAFTTESVLSLGDDKWPLLLVVVGVVVAAELLGSESGSCPLFFPIDANVVTTLASVLRSEIRLGAEKQPW